MHITSGKAALAYDVDGAAGAEPDVLLLHAGVTDRSSWRPLIDALGGDRRWISYDARGYGETTYQPEDYHQHDDALAVMDGLGLSSAVLVAASMAARRRSTWRSSTRSGSRRSC